MAEATKVVIFTDLDGTLLDSATYSYRSALPALELLQQKRIPLIFCSAKTRAEQETYHNRLDIFDPFIVENGGAIFIPQGYFPFHFDQDKTIGRYSVIELGMTYPEIRAILERIRSQMGVEFRGFGDMGPEEVARETGLELKAAWQAKQREYDETVKLKGSPEEIKKVLSAITKAGLNYAHGGRYYNVMGPNDKGKATTILIDLFRKKLGQTRTVGIGDSLNDLPMLSVVDIPILVQKMDGSWEDINLPRLHKVQGIGPKGWNRAIKEMVQCPTKFTIANP
jgi:mannosyl-3-phosphoglycerate phosphatase